MRVRPSAFEPGSRAMPLRARRVRLARQALLGHQAQRDCLAVLLSTCWWGATVACAVRLTLILVHVTGSSKQH